MDRKKEIDFTICPSGFMFDFAFRSPIEPDPQLEKDRSKPE